MFLAERNAHTTRIFPKMKTSAAVETSPLLGTAGRIPNDTEAQTLDNRAFKARRCGKWPSYISWVWQVTGSMLLLLAISFVGFRCLISVKMTRAWQQTHELPTSSQKWTKYEHAIVTNDNLQGTRLAFQVNDTKNEDWKSAPVPLVIVHGVEITAGDMDREAELLARILPAGTYVQSVEYAPGIVTYFEPLDDQWERLCQILRQHDIFGKAPVIDILGHSSGAVLARAVAQNLETCWKNQSPPTIRHYVGIAGPQQGVIAPIPGEIGRRIAGSRLLDTAFASFARLSWVSNEIVSTASYLYNPRSSIDDVQTNFGPTSFVGRVNQGYLLDETDLIRSNESNNSLDTISGNVLLVASQQDQVIQPTESAFFGRAIGADHIEDTFGSATAGNKYPSALKDVCDTDLWRRDTIGLRHIWEQGRLYFFRSNSQHGPLPENDYLRAIGPLLSGEAEWQPTKLGPEVATLTLEHHCREAADLQFLVYRINNEKIGALLSP